MPRREIVLTICLSALILTVGALAGAYVQALHDRDVAIHDRDIANRKLQQTNYCISMLEDSLASLAIVATNSSSFREQVIGVYLDFGNCLAKIQ